MPIALKPATFADVSDLVLLRAAVARDLTTRYGKGHWSSSSTERGVLFSMKVSTVFVARDEDKLIATLALSTRKPWAIDRKYFTGSKKPLYLTSMAVDPAVQGRGIGRLCIEQTRQIATGWPGDAIRLDAYNAPAGAGSFYEKCGFREVGRATYRTVPLIYFEMLLRVMP